jgi:tetratricopeptide (TPR) repeat protein
VLLVVWAEVLQHRFLYWDDPVNITSNPHLNPVTAESFRRFWSEPYGYLYIPVTYSMWAVEAWIAPPNAPEADARLMSRQLFHATNLALHIGCTLLVFALLVGLVHNRLAAGLGAMLFGLHPLQAETVSWCTETKGLLAAFFGLLALWLYQACLRRMPEGVVRVAAISDTAAKVDSSQNAGTQDTVPQRRTASAETIRPLPTSGYVAALFYVLATLSLVLALLSKPSAAAIPLLAGIWGWLILGAGLRRTVVSLIPWAAMVLFIAWVSHGQQADLPTTPVAPPWPQRVGVAADAVAFYVAKTAVPWSLGFDYGRTPTSVIDSGAIYYAWILPVGLVLVAACLPSRRIWLAAVGLFIAAVLPTSGLVPFSFQETSTVADRYVYLGLLGVAVAVAWWAAHPWRTAKAVGIALALAILAGLSYGQSSYWRDDARLFEHGIAVNPQSSIGHNMLGLTHRLRAEELLRRAAMVLAQGSGSRPTAPGVQNQPTALRAEAREHTARAEALFRRALEINPREGNAHHNLALVLFDREAFTESEQHFREAIRLAFDPSEAHRGLALLLSRQHRYDEAIQQFQLASADREPSVELRIQMAATLTASGDHRAAAKQYRWVLQLEPDHQLAARGLALALIESGHDDEAMPIVRRLLDAHPNDARLHFALGSIFLHRRDELQAAKEFRRALQIEPQLVEARGVLARTLHRIGQFGQASKEFERVLRERPEWIEIACEYAWLLATAPDSADRDGPRAVRRAEAACRATKNQDPRCLDALAAAYAETGRWSDAKRTIQLAISVARREDNIPLISALKEQSFLYEAEQPCRRLPRWSEADFWRC